MYRLTRRRCIATSLVAVSAAFTSAMAYGEEPPEKPRTTVALAKEKFLAGNYAAAAAIYQEECDYCRRKYGESDLRSAQMLNNLAVVLHHRGEMTEAEKNANKAFEYRREKLGATHPDTLTSENNLGLILHTVGDYTAAERNFRAVLDGRRKVLGADHPGTAQALNNLGCLLVTTGRFDDAEAVFKESLVIREKQSPVDEAGLAATLNNIAALKLDLRDPQATDWVRRAAVAGEKAFGGLHPMYAIVASNQARAERSTKEARKLFARAMDIQTETGADSGPDHALLLNKIVDFHINAMDERVVAPLAEKAVEQCLKVFGRRNPATALAMNNLAIIEYALRGDVTKAAGLLEESAHINEAILGQDHPAYAENLVNLARLHRQTDNVALAESLEAKAFAIFGKKGDIEDPRVISMQLNVAAYAVEKGNLDEAERLYADALKKSMARFGHDDIYTATAILGLGAVSCRLGREQQGEKLLDEASGILLGIRSAEDLRLAWALSMLGTSRCNLGRFDKALQPVQMSLAILESELPPTSAAIAACREQLAKIHEKLADPAAAAKLRASAPRSGATEDAPKSSSKDKHDT